MVVRGRSGRPAGFIAFWLASGRVVAGMNANVRVVVEPIKELIRRWRPVDPAHLVDSGVPIEEL